MKTLNSKKYFSILVCALSICAACAGYAETVTLWADSPVLNLNTNDVAQCIYLRLPYSGFQSGLSIQSSNHSCVSCQFTTTNQNDRPVVVGPAAITFSPAAQGVLCTFQITRAGDGFTPSNAVVVPDDGGAPVQIILESSTDLVTWTAALPGSYGTSTQKRFFRLRATR